MSNQKLATWTTIKNDNTIELLNDLLDSLECTRNEKNRIELVFLQGRLAYINCYVKDKGEIYEKLEVKYNIASLDDIRKWWTLNRQQMEHERSIKNNLGSD